MVLKKNTLVGKNKINLLPVALIFYFFFINSTFSQNNLEGNFIDLKILDKISSKNTLVKLKNEESFLFKDLSIKSLKSEK